MTQIPAAVRTFSFAATAAAAILLAIIQTGCTTTFFQREESDNPAAHAFLSYNPPPAGSKVLRLAVKDFIDVRGTVTSAGSRYLARNAPPATRDAPLLRIARQRGVWIVGKTNASEFGVTASGMNVHFGTPRSALKDNEALLTGGSSSGSAVAVATGLADVSFGTDTGGSVRIPAAYNGVYGLKTTFGLVPLEGVFPMSPKNLDTVGPLAKTLPRLVTGMELLQPGFATQYRQARASDPSARGLRVGRMYTDDTDPAIDTAVDAALKEAGFRVVVLGPKFEEAFREAQRQGTTVAVADAWQSDAKYRGKFGVSSTTKATILLGEIEYTLGYKRAMEYKPEWQRILRQAFQRVDLIALPTMKQLPPAIPRISSALFEAQFFSLQNTVAFNYSGNPAIAIPIPVANRKVPLTSLQLVAPPRGEAKLLNAARFVRSKG